MSLSVAAIGGAGAVAADLHGEHLELGLTLQKMKQLLEEPALSDVHGFRSSDVFSKELGWMTSMPFFNSEPVVFNSCELAAEYLRIKGRPDYSVAEFSYVDPLPG